MIGTHIDNIYVYSMSYIGSARCCLGASLVISLHAYFIHDDSEYLPSVVDPFALIRTAPRGHVWMVSVVMRNSYIMRVLRSCF